MSKTTVLDRVLPHNLPAEQSMIGTMILSKNAITDVYQILQTTDLYEAKHQVIFDTVTGLYSAGDSVDPLTLTSTLEETRKLGRVGGLDYVYILTHVVPTYANISYYVEIVRNRVALHGPVEIGTRVIQLSWAFSEGDAKDLINTVHQELDRVSRRRTSEDYKALKDLTPQVIAETNNTEPDPNMVRTSFRGFDTEIQGLRPGQMTIVAAHPGMEKSMFSLDICRYAAIHENKTAAVFSLEMSYAEIIKRLISTEASVPLSAINAGVSSADGAQSQAYWTSITSATNRMFEKPLYIDDSVDLTMPEIRAKCQRLRYNYDLSIMVVDYLQLMRGRGSAESRQQEVSETSCSLKLLAKELKIPIIAVAQLNRGSEPHTDKKPMISDLRESGSLGQDAGMVLLLHRPEAYNSDDHPDGADLYVARRRNGRTGTVHLTFQEALPHSMDATRVDSGGVPPRGEY